MSRKSKKSMKVFISFAKQDHHLVHHLIGLFVEQGITPLVATQRLSPGERLDEKVRRMIKESNCVLVIYTTNAARSRWVEQEIGVAKAFNKYIVPLKTHKSKLSAMLDGYEYYEFNASDPATDFFRVTEYLKEVAVAKGFTIQEIEFDSDDFILLHLPHAMLCPKCKAVDIHVFLCLLCGEWICGPCGATIPPSSRAGGNKSEKPIRSR